MTSVVVGFDGSEQSRRALERAALLAGGDAVTLVVAVPFTPIATKGPAVVVDPLEEEERAGLLQEAEKLLGERGARVNSVEAHGEPAAAICHAAETSGADLIVVGRHGRHFAATLRLGNVTAKVVNDAPCDVLVVH
jgi:nucleotide-binding universal stress UspA family protein